MIRQDSEAKSKWKRGLSKLRRQSTVSELSSGGGIPGPGSPSVMDADITELEVQDYFSKLKKKTGLNQLWSGRKFENAIDKDPDIDFSEEPRLRSGTLQELELTLDSDEEDLHKFIQNLSDANEDDVVSDKDETSSKASSKSELDLMKNVNFAELGPGVYEMPDIETDDDKDFLPHVVQPKFEDDENEKSFSASYSGSEIFRKGNINFLDSEVSSEKLPLKKQSSKVVDELSSAIDGDLSEEILEDVDESRVKTPLTPGRSTDYNYTESKFESYKSDETNSYHSDSLKKKNDKKEMKRKKEKSTPYSMSESDKSIGGSVASARSPSRSRSGKSQSSDSSRRSSRSSTSKSFSRSSSSSTSKTFSESSSSTITKTYDSKSQKRTKSKEKHPSKKYQNKQQDHRIKLQDLGMINANMIQANFASNYFDPSAIATTVVSEDALEAVSAYNPTSLALNDLLKYQLQLTRQHIDNSWRLYNAYAEPSAKGRHKYTTLKGTMKYIKDHAPSIISYEEALRQVKEGET